MNVQVTGPRGGALPAELSIFAAMAVNSFAKQLGISRLKTNILVKIHNQLIIPGNDAEGLCWAKDERNFEIDVCLYGNWLGVLAHEMVHVKQFALKELATGMNRWKSRTNVSDLAYEDQPWEKEAFRLQHVLLKEFTTR